MEDGKGKVQQHISQVIDRNQKWENDGIFVQDESSITLGWKPAIM